MNRLIFIILICLLVFIGCSDNSVEGSGTGTGNPIVLGQVVDDDDTAFANVPVLVRPADYYIVDSLKFLTNNDFYKIRNLKTDSLGQFIIDSIDTGDYVIEVAGRNDESVMYRFTITTYFDTIQLEYSPVLKNDTIRGVVRVFGGTDSEKSVFVEGIDRQAVTTNGQYELVLPAGVYNIKAITPANEVGISKNVNSYNGSGNVNILALNPISNNIICDTLIVRAVLDSNGIDRSIFYHAFMLDDDDNYIYQVDIEDPSFHTLPAIISGMRNLQELEIQFGLLSSVPKEIGLMTNLMEIELNDNKLTSLPMEITNLTPMRELNLRGNNFQNLPQEIIDWGNKYNALW